MRQAKAKVSYGHANSFLAKIKAEYDPIQAFPFALARSGKWMILSFEGHRLRPNHSGALRVPHFIRQAGEINSEQMHCCAQAFLRRQFKNDAGQCGDSEPCVLGQFMLDLPWRPSRIA